MTIDEQIIDSIAILTVKGDFWAGSSWDLHTKVKNCIEGGTARVVLDFSHIKRINSMGIGVIVACLKSLLDEEGGMIISGANTTVHRVLQLVNLYTYLETTDTVHEAVEKFRTRTS